MPYTPNQFLFIVGSYIDRDILSDKLRFAVPVKLCPISLFHRAPTNAFTGSYAFLNGQMKWFDRYLEYKYPDRSIRTFMNSTRRWESEDGELIIELGDSGSAQNGI
jgi:hypothetical protein